MYLFWHVFRSGKGTITEEQRRRRVRVRGTGMKSVGREFVDE